MQQTKRILAILLTLVLILGIFPTAAFAEGARPEDEGSPNEAKNYGLINQYHYGTTTVTDAYLRGESMQLNGTEVAQPTRDLPSKWDSRTQGWITSVKNQNPYGSCWAHAAMASVEAYMIKNGVPVGTGSAATTSLNLSETQHCFFNYTSAYDAEGMLTGDKSTPQDSCLDQGGNGEMSAYTLQRWTGVADESVSALAYSKASTVNSSGLSSQYAYGSNVAHVQNSEWIPGTNIDAVKQAIMDYGAGNISYYESGSAYTYTCTIDTSSQDSSSHKWANHAITIVGWDDSIAASRFSPNKPSGNGAWLCKNSWGTSQFNQGYMYISYEDTSVLEGYIYFYDAEPIDNYAHNYQYDGSCNVVCYGKGWPSGQDYYVGFANNAQVANVFTAKGNERLKAVAICNWDEGVTYTVDVYKNPTAGNPSSGMKMATQTGTLTFSGYYTIKLDNPVALAAGDTFSVVITLNCPTADDSGTYIHYPYDATFNNSDVVSWCSWIHANHGDTSYYKEPNGAWTDCPDNGDYRIKAYTDDLQFNLSAVSNNDAWGTVSVDRNKITATPSDGYYAAGYEVVSGEATVTREGNVFTVSATEDCTVQINFAQKQPITVTYVASGTIVGTASSYSGDALTLPIAATEFEGWSFVGWSEATIAETAEKPVFYLPGATVTPMTNTSYYALYSRMDETVPSETVYELVTETPSDWSGNYVITYGVDNSLYVMKGVTVTTNGANIENENNAATLSDTGMTLTDNTLRGSSDIYIFQVAKSGNYYTIQNASTSVYVGETKSNYLGGYKTYSSGYCDWTPGSQDGVSSATCKNGGSYPYLSFKPSGKYFWSQSSNGISDGYVQNVHWWRETTLCTNLYTTTPVDTAHEHELTHYEAVAPTCTAEGNPEYWRCGICGKYFSDASAEHEIAAADIVLPALGHDWSDWSVTTAPTCTEEGVETRTCSRCGETETRAIDAAGHTAGAAVKESEVAATCTTVGGYDMVVYCTVCNAELSREHTEIPALGHDWSEWTETTAPTCTEAGQETRTCSRCGETETRATDALGHDLVHHEAKAPTCGTDGWNAYDTCSRCDYSTYKVIPATGKHTAGAAVKENEVAATCTTAGGYDTVIYCTVCNAELSREHTEVPATGKHTAGAAVKENEVAATCTTGGGYDMVVYCTACNEELSREHTELHALGHNWSEWAQTKAPTCTEEGVETRTCARCGEAETRTVAKGEHAPAAEVKENETAATCTGKGGYDTVVYCSVCHSELSREHTESAALGHLWGKPVFTWNGFQSATATRPCNRDSAHNETKKATIVSEVVLAPTSTTDGVKIYTATVKFGSKSYTNSKTEILPAIGRRNPFVDVKEKDYFYEAVLWAYYHDPQVTAGTDKTHFSPSATCTREQVVTFLWRASGCPEPQTKTCPFTDVKKGSYYEKAVLWAVENDITKGTSKTKFGVGEGCTRGQVVTFLWRANGNPEPKTTNNPFKDVKSSAYYYKAVLWAVENGITAGTTKTTFSPADTCTRGQIVTFLYRAYSES